MEIDTIYALGTVGWMPNKHRQTTCFLIKQGSRVIILDAGTGLTRLLYPPFKEIVKEASEVIILLSHYHHDHIIGIGYIPLFFERKRVRIIGPGKELSGYNSSEVLNQMFSKPTFSLPLIDFPMKLSLEDLKPGHNKLSKDLTVDINKQQHSDPSVGMRLNDGIITFATDTNCSENTVEFAKGSRILIHEAYFDKIDYYNIHKEGEISEHSYSLGAAEIACKAAVKCLVLMHINPEYDENRIKIMEREAQEIFKNTLIPSDFEEIPF
ncbi:MAG: hypothetical protein QG657_824 [Acidobacteriota bacterium]|nr:hypothetical protein [Acidobacteriota bacterium]